MDRYLVFWRLTLAVAAALLGALVMPPSIVAQAQTEADFVQAGWTIGAVPDGGWTVGDRIPLRLTVTYRAGLEVILPELPASWGRFEVQDQSSSEPVSNADGTRSVSRSATITPWAPGEFLTPPLTVHYKDVDDQLRQISVPPLPITVVSVLEEGETEKRDLKPQVSLPDTSLLPWLMGGFLFATLIVAVGWAIYPRYCGRRAPSIGPDASADSRSPHQIAHSELDRIAALDLSTRGELKRHYTLVADCIRTYVRGRFHLPAMDLTTEELVAALHESSLNRRHIDLFRELLTEADLVKFAEQHPPAERAHAEIAKARQIVEATKTDESAAPFHRDDEPTRDSQVKTPESRSS